MEWCSAEQYDVWEQTGRWKRSAKRGETELDMSNLALNLVGTATYTRPEGRNLRRHHDDVRQLDAAASRMATFLDREGIGVGDRVGVMLPNISASIAIAASGGWAALRCR